MICLSCKKEIPKEDKFCGYCGHQTDVMGSQREDIQKTTTPKLLFLQKRFLVGIFVILILLIAYIIFTDNPFSFKQTGKPLISQEEIIASVVNILCPDSREPLDLEGEISGGSGTILTSDGLVLTNSHIIPQDDKFLYTSEIGCLVVLPDKDTGAPKEIYLGKPVVMPELSENFDLAFIEIYDVFSDEDGYVYGEYPRLFPSITDNISSNLCFIQPPLKLGESIRIFGYPIISGGYSLTVTDGIVSSFPEDGIILTSAKIGKGNSGGLAVDKDGCVVGIPSAVSVGEFENLGVIISGDLIFEFIEQSELVLEQPGGELEKQITGEQYPEIYSAESFELVGNELLRGCSDFQCEVILWGTFDGLAIVKEIRGEWYKVEVFEYGQMIPLDEYPYIKVVSLTNPIIIEGWLHKTLTPF